MKLQFKARPNKFIAVAAAFAVATPAMVVAVDTQAVEAATYTKTFSDVPKTNPYYDMIHSMTQEGIINGYPDGIFKPENAINRQQVVSLLNRALDLKPIRPAISFKDVLPSNGYYNDIQAVYRAGIVDGVGGNFNPIGSLTRAQMAKMLVNAFNLGAPKGKNPFTDTKGQWYEDYVTALFESGITTGTTATTFEPNKTVSRQHYAVFLYRALEYKKNQEDNEQGNEVPDGDVTPTPDPTPGGGNNGKPSVDDELIIENKLMVYGQNVLADMEYNLPSVEFRNDLLRTKIANPTLYPAHIPLVFSTFTENAKGVQVYKETLPAMSKKYPELTLSEYSYDGYPYTSTMFNLTFSDGYKNPRPSQYGDVAVSMASTERDGSLFTVIGDYRDARAVEIIKEVAKVYYPDYANYYAEFDEHVKYAADYWKTYPGHALGENRMSVIQIGTTSEGKLIELFFGVNRFAEYAVLELRTRQPVQ